MPTNRTSESIIPLFPCVALDETLEFYEALGFEVTHKQDDPYLYAAIHRGGVELHFSKLTAWHTKNSVCLVFVPKVSPHHKAFADALRLKYGRVPTAGVPRITRLKQGQTRFHVFDPSGNVLLYIDRNEPEMDYSWYEAKRSPLATAIDNATFLRDTYVNDKAAAQVLDKALGGKGKVDPVDRARALAARAELAIAMGDEKLAREIRSKLRRITLSDEDRNRFRDELEAADRVERWVTRSDS